MTTVSSWLAAQVVDQLEHLLLVADVERGGRLVEQHERRALGQRPGDEHPLALAAGERRRRSRSAKLEQVEVGEGVVHGGEVAAALDAERADVRRAAEQHVVDHAHAGRDHRRLRHEGHEQRPLAPGRAQPTGRPSRCRSPVPLTSPGRGSAAGSTCRRRWGRRSRPTRRGRPCEVDAVEHAACRRASTETPRAADHGVAPMRRDERSTSTKNGAPKNAVTTPIGISAGDDERAGEEVGQAQERAAEQDRQRQHDPVAAARRAGGRCAGR